ncbi:MAG: hypothetical protein M5U26_08755 [Planctomycetota bacterium]|nr:hypothetical protein [Planctomycetota bacterium]
MSARDEILDKLLTAQERRRYNPDRDAGKPSPRPEAPSPPSIRRTSKGSSRVSSSACRGSAARPAAPAPSKTPGRRWVSCA